MQRGASDGMDLCGMQGNLLIGVLVAGDWASCRLLKRGAETSRGGIRCAMEEIPEQVSGGGFRWWYFLEKGVCGFLSSVGKAGAEACFF